MAWKHRSFWNEAQDESEVGTEMIVLVIYIMVKRTKMSFAYKIQTGHF
jgi:hypothetical protein